MTAMKTVIRRFLRRIRPDTVRIEGSIIPVRSMRFGGANFVEDHAFLRSAESEAERLIRNRGLALQSRLLEIGCGTGRLPIGILRKTGDIAMYRGVDVSEAAIQWCERHITRHHPNFRFLHLDMQNARYHPGGRKTDSSLRLPFEDNIFDIIYAFSVLTHLPEEDVRWYLREWRRLLRPEGRIFFTAFVAEDVPSVSVNPEQYKQAWKGALHCVRFERGFFETMIEEHGFRIDRRSFEAEADEQTGYELSRRNE
jgi:SAM-dependent methyltransferase